MFSHTFIFSWYYSPQILDKEPTESSNQSVGLSSALLVYSWILVWCSVSCGYILFFCSYSIYSILASNFLTLSHLDKISSLLFSSLLFSFPFLLIPSLPLHLLFFSFAFYLVPFPSVLPHPLMLSLLVLCYFSFSALFCFSFLLFPVNIYSCFILSISLSIPFSQSLLFTFLLLSLSIFYFYFAYCVFTYDFSHVFIAHLNPLALLCLGWNAAWELWL